MQVRTLFGLSLTLLGYTENHTKRTESIALHCLHILAKSNCQGQRLRKTDKYVLLQMKSISKRMHSILELNWMNITEAAKQIRFRICTSLLSQGLFDKVVLGVQHLFQALPRDVALGLSGSQSGRHDLMRMERSDDQNPMYPIMKLAPGRN